MKENLKLSGGIYERRLIILEYQLIAPINKEYSAIEQILTNRGIKLEDIPHYLNTTEEDNLPTSLIANIDAAARMIIKHLNNKSKVYV